MIPTHWPTMKQKSCFNSARDTLAAAERIYQPLDRHRLEFRILHLCGSSSHNDVLKCRLETVSLLREPIPEYEAISYCWAEVTGRERILLNGKQFEMPASAAKVLRRFQPRSRFRALWIDALCINQDDRTERGHQVMLMGQIYRNTLRTLIWLGDANDTVPEAVRSIEKLSSMSHTTRKNLDSSGSSYVESVEWDDQEISAYLAVCDAHALSDFWGRPWFSRAWVLQEAVLAPTSNCYCGHWEISWLDISRAGRLCLNWKDSTGLVPRFQGVRGHETAYIGLSLANTVVHGHRVKYLPISSLLRQARMFDASDTRDKFYGLLGLTRWAARSKKFPKWMKVDYNNELATVLQHATRAAIVEMSSLGVLEDLNGSQLEDRHVPSWVVRWDLENSTYRSMPAFARLTASERHPRPQFPAPGFLHLDGFELDCISSVMPMWKPSSGTQELSTGAVRRSIEGCLMFVLNNTDFGYDELLILITGGAWLKEFEDDDTRKQFASECFGIVDGCSTITDAFVSRLKSSNTDNALLRVSSVCASCRIFLTRSGKIGVGPKSVQENDSIVVFGGAKVPFVVRPKSTSLPIQDESYLLQTRVFCRLVGPSFVHGVQDIWSFQALEEAGTEGRTFAIW